MLHEWCYKGFEELVQVMHSDFSNYSLLGIKGLKFQFVNFNLIRGSYKDAQGNILMKI